MNHLEILPTEVYISHVISGGGGVSFVARCFSPCLSIFDDRSSDIFMCLPQMGERQRALLLWESSLLS